MNKNSTPSSEHIRSLIRKALISGNYGTPAESTLNYIRNYALQSR